jgi:hypothetical protein
MVRKRGIACNQEFSSISLTMNTSALMWSNCWWQRPIATTANLLHTWNDSGCLWLSDMTVKEVYALSYSKMGYNIWNSLITPGPLTSSSIPCFTIASWSVASSSIHGVFFVIGGVNQTRLTVTITDLEHRLCTY